MCHYGITKWLHFPRGKDVFKILISFIFNLIFILFFAQFIVTILLKQQNQIPQTIFF
jgi:hypothetical protein